MGMLSAKSRSDPAVAADVFQRIFAKASLTSKRSYIRFFAEGLAYLFQRHPDRWGVTLSDWGMRLNVGWVECLVLHSGGARVLVEKDAAPTGAGFEEQDYIRARSCKMTTIPLSELQQVLPPLVASHHAALSIAAKWPATLSIRKAHSTGVTHYLSQLLGRQISGPSYAQSHKHVPSDRDARPAVLAKNGIEALALDGSFGHSIALSDVCVYTIISPENLLKETPFFRENKRWVSALKYLREAREKELQLAIIFANASQCSELIAWSTLKKIKIVGDGSTEYSVGNLHDVGALTRQDLIVLSTRQPIPEGHIKPYVLCATPRALNLIAKDPHPCQRESSDGVDNSSINLMGSEGKSSLLWHLHLERKSQLVKARRKPPCSPKVGLLVKFVGLTSQPSMASAGKDFVKCTT